MGLWTVAITVVHTGLSIVALLLGISTVVRWSLQKQAGSRETRFLGTAAAATITGFFFPPHGVTPAILIGIISSAVLVLTFVARSKAGRFQRGWSVLFVVGVIVSEYLLSFVTVAQAFGKVPFLHVLAPTLKELPFAVAQGIVLVLFVTLAALAIRTPVEQRIPAG